jgi:hypothetical protein
MARSTVGSSLQEEEELFGDIVGALEQVPASLAASSSSPTGPSVRRHRRSFSQDELPGTGRRGSERVLTAAERFRKKVREEETRRADANLTQMGAFMKHADVHVHIPTGDLELATQHAFVEFLRYKPNWQTYLVKREFQDPLTRYKGFERMSADTKKILHALVRFGFSKIASKPPLTGFKNVTEIHPWMMLFAEACSNSTINMEYVKDHVDTFQHPSHPKLLVCAHMFHAPDIPKIKLYLLVMHDVVIFDFFLFYLPT